MDSPTALRPESMEQHGSMSTLMHGATTTEPRMHAGQVLPSTAPGGWPRSARPWTTEFAPRGPVTPGPVRTQKDYRTRAEFDHRLMRGREELARARPGVSRRDLHELETSVKELQTTMQNELRYLRNLYDAMNVRVQAATAQQPVPPPQTTTTRAPVTLRMGAASSNPRVSPTLELTLPDDLWADAETRDLLESLTRNM